jgi:hypothetical protein
MPEAPVDEYGKAGMAKYEIWATWQSLVSTPAGNSSGAKKSNELHFGGLIAARPNGSHDLRAFSFRDRVGHGSILGVRSKLVTRKKALTNSPKTCRSYLRRRNSS